MILGFYIPRIMKNLKCDETLDRLSELPDSVILQILSFLEMRDVVRTTVLSKRWQNLWTTIPCLNFSEFEKSAVQTRNFVNRALMLWKGSRILKFKIDIWEDGFYFLSRDIDLWMRFVAERNVEELHLHLNEVFDDDYLLPQFLLSCSSITKLSFVGCTLELRGVLHWHQLKSLKIYVYSISEDVIDQVVSGTPRLEIFELGIWSESGVNLSLKSCSLKKLSIKCSLDNMIRDLSLYPMLTILAPNLESLVISGSPYSTCLMSDFSSLVDVNLDFSVEWDVVLVLRETLRQILPTFQHVERITFSSSCFKVLQVMKGKYSLSPLPNVNQLKFTCDLIGPHPHEVVSLLEIFPKLKTLDIDRRDSIYYPMSLKNIYSKQDIGESLGSEENLIKSFMMQLRIVEIGWYMYETSLYPLIEFFLRHAIMLEKIVIQKRGHSSVESEDMILAAEKLLGLQRSFPSVELVFCKKR